MQVNGLQLCPQRASKRDTIRPREKNSEQRRVEGTANEIRRVPNSSAGAVAVKMRFVSKEYQSGSCDENDDE